MRVVWVEQQSGVSSLIGEESDVGACHWLPELTLDGSSPLRLTKSRLVHELATAIVVARFALALIEALECPGFGGVGILEIRPRSRSDAESGTRLV